jgi:hypothetical protein
VTLHEPVINDAAMPATAALHGDDMPGLQLVSCYVCRRNFEVAFAHQIPLAGCSFFVLPLSNCRRKVTAQVSER